jgi:hemerythrin
MDGLVQRDAARAPKAELSGLLDTLQEQTEQHFKEEEAYMAATGYAKLDVHQVIHRELLLKLEEHVDRFKAEGERLGAGLLSFLKFWLWAHINGADRQRQPRQRSRPAPTEAAEPTTCLPSARLGDSRQ